jgi:serine O-acetyltransferase
VPIDSRAELRRHLEGDAWASGMHPLTLRRRMRPTGVLTILRFQRKLRRLEYLLNRRHRGRLIWGPIIAVQRLRVRRAGIRLGFTIPPNVFGPALCLPHWGTIVVSERAVVGVGCRLHPSTTIAAAEGGAPVLGENVFVGPGARIIGPVHLGDFVVVGANAVVTRSFPAGAVIAGVPARVIGERSTEAWIA